MKLLAILTGLVYSLNVTAAELTEYVACKNVRSEEYNFVLEVVNKKVTSLSVLETDFKYYEKVADGQTGLFFQYTSENDTDFGYTISLNSDLTETIYLAEWTAGHDADNMNLVISDAPTACHLLKMKPVNSVLTGDNVARILQVNTLK